LFFSLLHVYQTSFSINLNIRHTDVHRKMMMYRSTSPLTWNGPTWWWNVI